MQSGEVSPGLQIADADELEAIQEAALSRASLRLGLGDQDHEEDIQRMRTTRERGGGVMEGATRI